MHQLFLAAPDETQRRARADALSSLARFDGTGPREALTELVRLGVLNHVHRMEDAVDPRGKCALFGVLDLYRPRVRFLGAADGYETMQLATMYPAAEVVLVDYDVCCTKRFGKFAVGYPFLGVDPASRIPASGTVRRCTSASWSPTSATCATGRSSTSW